MLSDLVGQLERLEPLEHGSYQGLSWLLVLEEIVKELSKLLQVKLKFQGVLEVNCKLLNAVHIQLRLEGLDFRISREIFKI